MIKARPLFSETQIQERVKELADQISSDYEGKDLIVVPILKGAFMFASDLVRRIRVPLTIDFVMAKSYMHTDSTGEVTLHLDVREKLTNRHVLLIEDIVDTGVTLNYLRERFMQQRPASLKICGLLNKKSRREVDLDIDYVGFEVPDVFVVGYGLDYDDKYRNLPHVAVFTKEVEKE